MNLKKLFTRSQVGLIMLLIFLSILSLFMFLNKINIERTNEIRLNSYGIASNLRKTSIDLTRYCRTYIFTGDSTWEDKYLKNLDVYYGNKPRPNGRIISYQDSLKNFDFTKEEFFLLEKASQKFINLIAIEKVAMYAAKGLFDDGSGNFTVKGIPDIVMARTILFDERYHDDKAVIMNSIENFYQVFKPRVQKIVNRYNIISYWLIGIINTLIILIIIISSFLFFAIKNKIIVQLEELKKSKSKAEESNRLKTEFLNNMSHEIRTPMNGILGFSKMLLDSDITVEKRTYFVNIILNSGNQLLQIIDNILEIYELETNQVKVVDTEVCLNDVLLKLFSVFDIKAKENKTPLYFKKGLSDRQSTILIDKTKLNKVLNNLLENAIKFTYQGSIEFGYSLKNENIEFYVKDTGVGIELEHQKLIFNRFSQAEKDLSKKVGGLGLGLSLAKENTELLGGEISVVSEKGSGTTFLVSIPYKPIFIDDEIDDDKFKILIAEDEEVNYLFLEIILIDEMKLNCNILHAKNGLEAVEICKNNPEIDFVFMDIKMPKMNGFEAAKQIKKIRPNLPIVALTAYSTLEDKEKAINVGCVDFITKPIKKETVKKSIKKYLELPKEN